MKTGTIGSLQVSTLGIGCNNLGMKLEYPESEKLLHGALDLGVNYFDTADMYGGTQSESFIGKALADRRDKAVIATKFGMQLDENRKGAHPSYVKQACDASLQRLQTDYIDLYILHTPDPSVPIADTLGALNELVAAGKVREIGCSNFTADMLQEAADASAGMNKSFVNVQNEYNLLKRDDETQVFPKCDSLGITYSPYFPLANGLLTGKYRKGQAHPAGSRLDAIEYFQYYASDTNMDKVEALIGFAEAQGKSPLDVAMGWLITRDCIASVIAGATSIAQIQSNIAALEYQPDAAQQQEISALVA